MDLLNLYKQHGAGIFDTNFFDKLWNVGDFFDEKYSAAYLEDQLKKYFGDTRLSELLRPCLITAYDIFQRKGVFFNSEDGREKGDRNDFLVRSVARATSAAPTYFEPANIQAIEGTTELPLVDGGIFANNPAMCSIVEASKLVSKRVSAAGGNSPYRLDLKNMRLISISTGLNSANIDRFSYGDAKGFGKIQWVTPLIDIMMSASSETIHYQLQTMFQCTGNEENYLRLKPELYRASPKMDDASAGNIDHLLQDADQYINENRALLDKLAEELYTGPKAKGNDAQEGKGA
jgi:patatin-like phospholipase/acyl hydrolase